MVKTGKTDFFEQFLKIISALNTHGVDYIVIGGVAMITHGMPRLTRDLDLLIKMTTENIKKLRQALSSLYDDHSIDEITLDDLLRYAVIRYGTPDDFALDLMAGVGEVADYETIKVEEKEIEGIQIRVATIESMLALKSKTIRPEDQRDAIFLKQLIANRGE